MSEATAALVEHHHRWATEKPAPRQWVPNPLLVEPPPPVVPPGPTRVTAAEVRQRRKAMRLSRQEMATALGVHVNTIDRWEWAGHPNSPPAYLDLALRWLEHEAKEGTR